jgi:DNA-binding NtrC family response regulator
MTQPIRKRILVVDDEQIVCKSIRQALVRDDVIVDIALSADEAIRLQKAGPYDVIIIDLMMPGVSGLDLLKSLKEMSVKARIIMITGYPTMRNTIQAMQIGAFEFLPKPFLPSDLRGAVDRALETQPD